VESAESFGQRLARLRREAGYTQKELGEELGISQRMVAYYEGQTEHPPTKLMPLLAGALGVSADELLGVAKAPANNAPIKNRRLYRQLQNIEKLPKRDQQALLRTIDAFLAKAQ